MKHIVDAHALIWYLESNPLLGPQAKAAMDDPNAELLLPIIALAEVCWAVGRGKTRIPSIADLLRDVDADSRIQIVPLDRETFDVSLTLISIGEMHDRQIVALAVLLQNQGESVVLLTKDSNIVASGLVPIVW